MKKNFLTIALVIAICLTGCSSLNDKDIRKKFIKDVENLKSYELEGVLTITNNDDTYKYDVNVNYEEDDKYKVSMTNKANNYEQIILKNDEGVYVLTHKGLTFFQNMKQNVSV